MSGISPYRTPTQSQYHLTPPQNNKRYSRNLQNDIVSSTLNNNSFSRPSSPSDSEYRTYPRSNSTRTVTSPPLDSTRGHFTPPTSASGNSYSSKTPRTPYGDYKPSPPIGGPGHHNRPGHKSSPSLDHGIMSLDIVRQVSSIARAILQ